MKFLMAVLAHVAISAILGWRILLTVKSNPWLLIEGLLASIVAGCKLGCQPGESH
jgi:hypothetical protein